MLRAYVSQTSFPTDPSYHYLLHPAHFAIGEPHLDPVGVGWTVGKDVLDGALGQVAAPLVLFQDDLHAYARLDLATLLMGQHVQSYEPRA